MCSFVKISFAVYIKRAFLIQYNFICRALYPGFLLFNIVEAVVALAATDIYLRRPWVLHLQLPFCRRLEALFSEMLKCQVKYNIKFAYLFLPQVECGDCNGVKLGCFGEQRNFLTDICNNFCKQVINEYIGVRMRMYVFLQITAERRSIWLQFF